MTKQRSKQPLVGGKGAGSAEDKLAYGGRERRHPEQDPDETGRVRFDDRGNAVWEWAEVPRRRADDDTLDLLKALEPEGLSLADDPPSAEEGSPNDGFNPYDTPRRER